MADSDVAVWAASGAMALTGRPDGPPLVAPAGLVNAAASAAGSVATMTARFGTAVQLDGPALLGERAALAGMVRQGCVSVGGAARFERACDGWVVLNLPRPDDIAALPALLEADVDPQDWRTVSALIASRTAVDLVDRGRLLGVAIARPDEQRSCGVPERALVRGPVRSATARPLVIDFTSLWAGPLAGSILASAGARVIKIEGRNRPDGARLGPAPFFDLMNGGKEMLAVDFHNRADVRLLQRLIGAADLVIEASRPRAMEQIGIQPAVVVADTSTSWLSITAHGRVNEPDRVGFGDDAAVAGGVWVEDLTGPLFVADAVADPLTGLVAASLGAELLAAERAALVETPLSQVAAWAGRAEVNAPVHAAPDGDWHVIAPEGVVSVVSPRARVPARRAAPFDAHGPALRDEFA